MPKPSPLPVRLPAQLRITEACTIATTPHSIPRSTAGGPFHQQQIQKKHIRKAGIKSGIGGDIGWHTFRHSYRSWLDETGVPLTDQKELMRHASHPNHNDTYGKAMTDSKRQAHRKVVEMVLNSSKSEKTADQKLAVAAIGSEWEFVVRSKIRATD